MNLPFEILQTINNYLGFLESLPLRRANKQLYQKYPSPPLYLHWKQYQNAFVIRSPHLSYTIPYNLYHLIYDYKSLNTLYQIMFENHSIPKHLQLFVHPTPIFNDSQLDRFIIPYFKIINNVWGKKRNIPYKLGGSYHFLDIHHQPLKHQSHFKILEYILQNPSFYKEIYYLSIDDTPFEIKNWIPQLQTIESLTQRLQLFLKLFIHLVEKQIQQFIFISHHCKWLKHLQTYLQPYYYDQPVFSTPQWIRCCGQTQQQQQCRHQTHFQDHSSIHWYCHQHQPRNTPLLKPSFLIPN